MADIKFKRLNITVLSFDPDQILVEWELFDTVLPLQDYTFRIERSEHSSAYAAHDKLYFQPPNVYSEPEDSESSEVFHLQTVSGDQLNFVDHMAELHDTHKKYYYRVVAKNIKTKNIIFSPVGTWDGEPSLVAAEMIRRLHWLLDDRTGEPSFYFQQMKESPRCPRCWDPATQRTTNPDCSYCMGTGVIVGYYRPVLTMIDFYPDNKITQHVSWGETQPNDINILMSNYPVLQNRGIIIKAASRRAYRVENVRPIEEPGSDTIIHQVAQITEISRSDIENKLTIPLDLQTDALTRLNDRKEKREF